MISLISGGAIGRAATRWQAGPELLPISNTRLRPSSPAVARDDPVRPRRKQRMVFFQGAQIHPATPLKNEQLTTKNNLNDTDIKNNNS